MSIERGDDFVSHYEVIVRGNNFFNSILTVSQAGDAISNLRHRPLAPGGRSWRGISSRDRFIRPANSADAPPETAHDLPWARKICLNIRLKAAATIGRTP